MKITNGYRYIGINGGGGSKNMFPENATAVFRCFFGYTIFGDWLLTCQRNGTWNSANPICLSKNKFKHG